jgi:hypothetical protein
MEKKRVFCDLNARKSRRLYGQRHLPNQAFVDAPIHSFLMIPPIYTHPNVSCFARRHWRACVVSENLAAKVAAHVWLVIIFGLLTFKPH